MKLRLFDLRTGADPVRITEGHGGIKGARIVWTGEHDRIATTGFSKMSDRQVSIWETGGLGNVKTLAIGQPSGVAMVSPPFFFFFPFSCSSHSLVASTPAGKGSVFCFERQSGHSLRFEQGWKHPLLLPRELGLVVHSVTLCRLAFWRKVSLLICSEFSE